MNSWDVRQLIAELAEARAVKADLARFVEHAVMPIHRLDRDGIIRWANAAELELLGYRAHEYVGRQISELHVDPAVIDDILARLRRGESVHDREVRVRAKDGSIRVLEISANADGELVTTCFSRDVTALKQAEEDRDTVDRTIDLLAGQLELDRVVRQLTDETTELCRAELGTFLPTADGAAAIRLDDVTRDPRYGTTLPHAGIPRHLRACSYLAVPVIAKTGDALGSLVFCHSDPGVFTARDERLLTAIASRAAAAIANARRYEAERTARIAAEAAARSTALLHSITSALSRASSAEEAARVVIDEARKLIGAPAGVVLLLDEQGTRVERLVIEGETPRAQIATKLTAMRLDADMPICEAARTGQLLWIVGADAIATRYPHLTALRDELHAMTWGAVPIGFDGRTYGAIGLSCSYERRLTPDEESMLLAIARQCGEAIVSARASGIPSRRIACRTS